MDEELLAGIERLLASSPRRKASDDLTPDEKVTILIENSNLVQAVPDLVAEVRRLQAVELEALRVLGAVIVQHVQQRLDVPEEALRRDYTVTRTYAPATQTVRFRAELAERAS